VALGRTVGSTNEQDKIISSLNSKFSVALCVISTINRDHNYYKLYTCDRHYRQTDSNNGLLNPALCSYRRRCNKSDISYLKTSQAFDVPIHSRALLAAILCCLATL